MLVKQFARKAAWLMFIQVVPHQRLPDRATQWSIREWKIIFLVEAHGDGVIFIADDKVLVCIRGDL